MKGEEPKISAALYTGSSDIDIISKIDYFSPY
jgi:hypothetical protein